MTRQVMLLAMSMLLMTAIASALGQTPLTGTRIKTQGSSSTRMSIQFQDPQEVTQIQRLLALGKTDDALKLALNYLTQVEKAGMAVQIRYFARNALCVVYTSTRDDSKAEQECTRAIELMPSHWSAWNNRGTLRYLMGDMAGAHADYQQALGHSGNKNDVVDLLTHNLSLVRFKSMLQQ